MCAQLHSNTCQVLEGHEGRKRKGLKFPVATFTVPAKKSVMTNSFHVFKSSHTHTHFKVWSSVKRNQRQVFLAHLEPFFHLLLQQNVCAWTLGHRWQREFLENSPLSSPLAKRLKSRYFSLYFFFILSPKLSLTHKLCINLEGHQFPVAPFVAVT